MVTIDYFQFPQAIIIVFKVRLFILKIISNIQCFEDINHWERNKQKPVILTGTVHKPLFMPKKIKQPIE